ncbi:MAG: cysteine hydrolase family protein [Actinomycetota bacterium]
MFTNFDFDLDPLGPHGIKISSWLETKRIALVVVDLQNYITRKRYSGKWSSGSGKGYYGRIDSEVIPNSQKLIGICRKNNMLVVFTRIASMSGKLLDVPGMPRKVLAGELEDKEGRPYHLLDGEDASRIDDRLKPRKEDVVVAKTSSGAFCSSELDLVLRANNISRLIFVGAMTDACLSSSVRGAYDRGYLSIIAEDGCIAATMEDHRAALRSLEKYYGWVTTTEDIILNLRRR